MYNLLLTQCIHLIYNQYDFEQDIYCNYYYKDAIELMNIRISGASELNGDAAREVNRACNVKNMFERNARERL